jgi:hypothetical protein
MRAVVAGAVALYRAWPLRPRCRSAAGIHAWPCRLLGMSRVQDGPRCGGFDEG